MKLSVVIPAYNEEKRLPPSLEKIYRWVKKHNFSWEIIVVDDGSYDNMLSELEKFKKRIENLKVISYKPNRGKGYAVRKGILKAQGNIIILTDADLSTPIEEAEKLMKKINNGVDIAVGSRLVEGAKVSCSASWFRNTAAKVFLLGVKILLLYGPKDTQCGFKAFSKKVARKIFLEVKSSSILYDLEIFLLAKRNGFKLVEVPVVWKHDPDSKLRYNLRKSVAIWLELFQLKILYKIILPVRIITQ